MTAVCPALPYPRERDWQQGCKPNSVAVFPSRLSHPRPFPRVPMSGKLPPLPNSPPAVTHGTFLLAEEIKVILLGFYKLPKNGCHKTKKTHYVLAQETRSLKSK